jgi:hypothetical protein
VSCSVRGKIVGTLGGESSEAARPRALNGYETARMMGVTAVDRRCQHHEVSILITS